MRQKNTKKREEIRKVAYRYLSEKDYRDILLKDIASDAGISKSMLQHFYPQKYLILWELVEQFMTSTFDYVVENIGEDKNTHLKLAIFTHLLWESADRDARLDHMMSNAFNDTDVTGNIMESLYQWLKKYRYHQGTDIELPVMKTSLIFAVSGGMALYYMRDQLNVTISFICNQITTTYMEMMGCEKAQIQEVIKQDHDFMKNFDWNQFAEYCLEKIPWLPKS